LSGRLTEKDVVVFLGAGDIGLWARRFVGSIHI
jgi:hypothetical protein